MENVNKTYKDLLNHMDKHIPSSREHVNSLSCVLGREILNRRLTLGLTQAKLAEKVKDVTGKPMHQSTVSEAEGGTAILTTETYDRLLKTLNVSGFQIIFESMPLSDKKEGIMNCSWNNSSPKISHARKRFTVKKDNISL